jgi:hypothetical protein
MPPRKRNRDQNLNGLALQMKINHDRVRVAIYDGRV